MPSPTYLTIVDVYYTEGLPEAYLLPIAYAPAEKSAELHEKNKAAVLAWVTLEKDSHAASSSTRCTTRTFRDAAPQRHR